MPKMPSADNPLSMIALFIWLTYGVAGLTFTAAAAEMAPGLQWTAMLFMALFPVIMFAGFVFLVIHHHEKLYSPRDFVDERLFFGPNDPHAYGDRAIQEVSEQQAEFVERDEETISSMPASESVGEPETPTRGWEVDPRLSEITVAESLVFLELQSEFEGAVQRNQMAGDVGVDGVIFGDGPPILVEIKLLRNALYTSRLNFAAHRFFELTQRPRYGAGQEGAWLPRALLAIVTDFEGEQLQPYKDKLSHIASKYQGASVRFYEFRRLAEKYGLTAERMANTVA
tara:strand:- start:2519 stop:3370 length:852 start_codon:yes stop_codon:yes gene_type:complete